MEIPGLGSMTRDRKFGWYESRPLELPLLGDRPCRILVEGYDDDPNPGEFHAAIENFLSAPPSVLLDASPHVFRYYQDCKDQWDEDDELDLDIDQPADVWDFVEFGDEAIVSRRAYGDRAVYVSLSCSCEWEEEHGLQLVFKHGQAITKVGPYDGHLTHSDACDDPNFDGVVYK